MKGIIFLVLFQNWVISEIQVLPKTELDLFNNMMKSLIENCRTEFGTIGFWGGNRIFTTDEADVVLLNKNEEFKKSPTRRIKFLVVILDEFYPRMPKFSLYNVNPTLAIETMFVLDRSNFNKKFVFKIFKLFQKSFENSKVYYCNATEGRIEIITINAFADVAPPFWAKIKDFYYHGIGERWRVFKAQYNETKFNCCPDLCNNVLFNRIKVLNGYEIKGAVKRKNGLKSMTNTLITKDSTKTLDTWIQSLMTVRFSEILSKYLNISIRITYDDPNTTGKDVNFMSLNRTIDLSLQPVVLATLNGKSKFSTYFRLSYPFNIFYDQIVTNNRGLLSPLEKMFEFYGWLTIIATIIILFVILIVIYLSNSENNSKLSFAVFECLRLLINNSIYTRMDTAKMRIFFSVIFLYFLVIQATFSGHLATFLTKAEYRKNVETLEDLKDPRYSRIYARKGSRDYINDSVLLNKTKFGFLQCKKHIYNKSVACIDRQDYLDRFKVEYKLHTAKNSLTFMYSSLMMRYNWPLRYRVNNLVLWLSQSGVKDFWDKQSRLRYTQKLKRLDLTENYHRPIEIGDIRFAFCLLGVGLLSAVVCFAVEFSIKIFPIK